MAAMDVARSFSLHPRSPPSSETLRAQAASPEPHYRLSRLNTPPSSATLRPPSIISRSVSAGMTFPFTKSQKEKEREKHEKEKSNKDAFSRAPSPDDRASSRFGFNLRKKVSLASMRSSQFDDAASSRTSSSSGPSHTVVISPIEETTAASVSRLRKATPEEEAQEDEVMHATGRFVKNDTWRVRNRHKLHPYLGTPYMLSYDVVMLQSDRATNNLMRCLVPPGSPAYKPFGGRPPATVLDLGCGEGVWLADAARIWRGSQFIGLDLVDILLPALTDGSIPNVRLVRGDFINYPLPFPAGRFDYVRLANLGLCVPEPCWEYILREVERVLAPDGRLEWFDDQMAFPYGDTPFGEAIDIPKEMEMLPATTPTAHIATEPAKPLSPSTPRAPPPTPESSGFFDSSDDEGSDEGEEAVYKDPLETSDDEVLSSPTPDSASERSSFCDTASTLIGDASERGSLDLTKSLSGPPRLEFEPIHRPFSGVEHLVISIPSPDPLTTVDVTIEDGDMPLTPVPPRSAAKLVQSCTSIATASPAVLDYTSAPPTPIAEDDEDSESEPDVPLGSGPWSTQRSASLDLERVYTRMLKTEYNMHPKPAEFAMPLLKRVFGHSARVEKASMHLKLAPVGTETRDDVQWQYGMREKRDSREAQRNARTWMRTIEREKEGREPERESMRRSTGGKTKSSKKEEWAAKDTPIPQGLSAKAAERLGIVGAGVPQLRRQPTLVESPDESEEEDFSEEFSDSDEGSPADTKPTQGRDQSAWVPPSEWDAPAVPPALTRGDSAPMLRTITHSTSTNTLTTASSSCTIMPTSKTVKQLGLGTSTIAPERAAPPLKPTIPVAMTHTRGGSNASTASCASALSTASDVSVSSSTSTASSGAWSATGPHEPRFSHELVQHPGLVLWPNTFIPQTPMELELHATKHMTALLGSKHALGEYVSTYTDATGERLVSDEEFQEALWQYECFRRWRFNWPELPDDDEAPDLPTPSSARSMHHPIPPRTPTTEAPTNYKERPFGSDELTHVRTFRVFTATKGPKLL